MTCLTEERSIDIRPWRDGDEVALTQLHERVFGRVLSTSHWTWKLRPSTPPFQNVWLAVCDHVPVFQYAGIPIRFRLSGSEVQAAVSVDTMTAPEFRRRGLLTQVATRAYDFWRAADVAFVIGLPNENWGSRARALGWQPLFPLQWLVRPLRPEVMLRWRTGWRVLERLQFIGSLWNAALRSRVRPDPATQVEPATEATADFDCIWQAAGIFHEFSTVRDSRWVARRFFTSPTIRYEVSLARRADRPTGYMCHSVLETGGRRTGYLAEIFHARGDSDTRNTLLAALIRNLADRGIESVRTLAIPGTEEYSWLRSAGFLPSHAFRVEIVPLRADLPLERMRQPHRWHLSGADFDVV